MCRSHFYFIDIEVNNFTHLLSCVCLFFYYSILVSILQVNWRVIYNRSAIASGRLSSKQAAYSGSKSNRQLIRRSLKNIRHFLSMGEASKSALLISDYGLFILGGCSSCDGIGRAAGAIHDKLGRHLVCTLVGKLEGVSSNIAVSIYHINPLDRKSTRLNSSHSV